MAGCLRTRRGVLLRSFGLLGSALVLGLILIRLALKSVEHIQLFDCGLGLPALSVSLLLRFYRLYVLVDL